MKVATETLPENMPYILSANVIATHCIADDYVDKDFGTGDFVINSATKIIFT
jgi:hypothetical protein